MNDFIPTTSLRQFETMRGRYQIPPYIPIRFPEKFGKCYYKGVRDVGVYEQMFKASLRLPLTDLHRHLVEYLGLSFNQIALNASRVFLGVEVLYGKGGRLLTLEKFFTVIDPWRYQSQRACTTSYLEDCHLG